MFPVTVERYPDSDAFNYTTEAEIDPSVRTGVAELCSRPITEMNAVHPPVVFWKTELYADGSLSSYPISNWTEGRQSSSIEYTRAMHRWTMLTNLCKWFEGMRGGYKSCSLRRDRYIEFILRWPETMAHHGFNFGYPGMSLEGGDIWYGNEDRVAEEGRAHPWSERQAFFTQMCLSQTCVSYQVMLLHMHMVYKRCRGWGIVSTEERVALEANLEGIRQWNLQGVTLKKVKEENPFGGLDKLVDTLPDREDEDVEMSTEDERMQEDNEIDQRESRR